MKAILRTIPCLLIFVISANLLCSESFAYLTQKDTAIIGRSGGHEEITDWSIDALKYDIVLQGKLRDFRENIRNGTRAEDEVMLGVLPKSYRHFYPTAATYGQGLYDKAIAKYRNDKAVA